MDRVHQHGIGGAQAAIRFAPFLRFGQSGEIPRYCQWQGYLGADSA